MLYYMEIPIHGQNIGPSTINLNYSELNAIQDWPRRLGGTQIIFFNGTATQAIEKYSLNEGSKCNVTNFTIPGAQRKSELLNALPDVENSLIEYVRNTKIDKNEFWNKNITLTNNAMYKNTHNSIFMTTVAPIIVYDAMVEDINKKINLAIYASILTQFDFRNPVWPQFGNVLIFDVDEWCNILEWHDIQTNGNIMNNFRKKVPDMSYATYFALQIASIFIGDSMVLEAYDKICFPIPRSSKIYNDFYKMFVENVHLLKAQVIDLDQIEKEKQAQRLANLNIDPMRYLHDIYESDKYNLIIESLKKCDPVDESILDFFPICYPKDKLGYSNFLPNYTSQFKPKYIFDTYEQIVQFVRDEILIQKYVALNKAMILCAINLHKLHAKNNIIFEHMWASAIAVQDGLWLCVNVPHKCSYNVREISSAVSNIIDHLRKLDIKLTNIFDIDPWGKIMMNKFYDEIMKASKTNVQSGGKQKVKYITSKLLRSMRFL